MCTYTELLLDSGNPKFRVYLPVVCGHFIDCACMCACVHVRLFVLVCASARLFVPVRESVSLCCYLFYL